MDLTDHYFALLLTGVEEERFRTLQAALSRALDFPSTAGEVVYHRSDVSAGVLAVTIAADGTWSTPPSNVPDSNDSVVHTETP